MQAVLNLLTVLKLLLSPVMERLTTFNLFLKKMKGSRT